MTPCFETLHQLRCRHIAERIERIRATVDACHGNRTEAARLLGVDRCSLLRDIRRYDIPVPPTSQGQRSKNTSRNGIHPPCTAEPGRRAAGSPATSLNSPGASQRRGPFEG